MTPNVTPTAVHGRGRRRGSGGGRWREQPQEEEEEVVSEGRGARGGLRGTQLRGGAGVATTGSPSFAATGLKSLLLDRLRRRKVDQRDAWR